jgi:hypothetical protein
MRINASLDQTARARFQKLQTFCDYILELAEWMM